MFSANLDTTRLNDFIALYAKESKKGIDEVVLQQSAIIVGHLIAMTPPGKSKGKNMNKDGRIEMSAKKLGENTMKADLNSLFPTVRLKSEKVWGMIENGYRWGTGRGAKKIGEYAESVADLRRVHRKARSPRTGRVRTGTIGQNMALTKASIRNQYIKEQIKEVGMLAAGWLAAGEELGTTKRAMPAWIRRHGRKPGSVTKRKSKTGLTVTVMNKMPYFPKNMESRMQSALYRREIGLEKAVDSMIQRKADKLAKRLLR